MVRFPAIVKIIGILYKKLKEKQVKSNKKLGEIAKMKKKMPHRSYIFGSIFFHND